MRRITYASMHGLVEEKRGLTDTLLRGESQAERDARLMEEHRAAMAAQRQELVSVGAGSLATSTAEQFSAEQAKPVEAQAHQF